LSEPAGSAPDRPRPASSELKKRVFSALALAALAIVSVVFGGLVFAAVWGVAALAVLYEWNHVIGLEGMIFRRALVIGSIGVILSIGAALWFTPSFVPALVPLVIAALILGILPVSSGPGSFWVLFGPLYAASVVIGPLLLRGRGVEGIVIMFWLFLVVWISDIAAFFVGRRLGGPKLWPKVSPKKTWSGFIGGLLGGTLVPIAAVYSARYFFSIAWLDGLPLFAMTATTALVSECGDLFESAMKRRFGVKDSGSLIPGHGGMMDRLDSYTAAALFVALMAAASAI
jgi:phosphatidate cytidylyltransferase